MSISERFASLGRSLSPIAAWRLGRLGGRLAFAVEGRRRRRAEEHLAAAFPEKNRTERRAVARAAFLTSGATAAVAAASERLDLARLCRSWTLANWRPPEHSEGSLVVASRFGFAWHTIVALALYRAPLTVVADGQRYPRLQRWLAELQHGQALVEWRSEAPPPSNGSSALMLEDAGADDSSVEIPFLGRTVRVSGLGSQLARDLGSDVRPIFGHLVSQPTSRRLWHIDVGQPLAATGDGEALIHSLVVEIERRVRQQPHLWPWWRRGF